MIKADPLMEQDITIGQYTLGLLASRDTARLQALLSSDAAAARSALRWEEEFLALVDALPPIQPPHQLLESVLTTLDLPLLTDEPVAPVRPVTPVSPDTPVTPLTPGTPATRVTSSRSSHTHRAPEPEIDRNPVTHNEPQSNESVAGPRTALKQAVEKSAERLESPARKKPIEQAPKHKSSDTAAVPPPTMPKHDSAGKRPSKAVWVGGAVLAVVLLALLTLLFVPSTPAEPPIVIVEVAPSKGAILQAPGQSSTPGWVVTVDLENNVTLTPQVHTETPADASVQLWTYNTGLPQPRSLGLIDPNQPVAVPAQIMGEIGEGQFFEMTLEPEGGSLISEPSGPILFIGRVVTFSQ